MPTAERKAHFRRRKAEGLALDLQSLRAHPTYETLAGPTTYSHKEQNKNTKTGTTLKK
jgi:hypothetical protein